jgi:hypothetical protein
MRWLSPAFLGLSLLSSAVAHGSVAVVVDAFNASVSTVRAAVERANSHLQNWKILVTRFRPPLEKFPATLRAIVGLYFLKWAFE